MKAFLFIFAALASSSAFEEAPLRLCARYGVWLPQDKEQLRELNRYVLKDYVIDRARPWAPWARPPARAPGPR